MRLIDADALKKVIYFETNHLGIDFHKSKLIGIAIDNAPTIDAEPTRHGKWIKVGDNTYRCSRCNEVSCCNGNFCTDCGAKLDEEQL